MSRKLPVCTALSPASDALIRIKHGFLVGNRCRPHGAMVVFHNEQEFCGCVEMRGAGDDDFER